MANAWKHAPIRDDTSRELRRLRLATERHLRERRRRARLADIDGFLWSYWYRLRDDVCDRLGAVVEARTTRRANALERGRGRSWTP